MHAATPTRLSLAEFAEVLQLNPLHVAGIQMPGDSSGGCSLPWPQYGWQDSDRVGREAIARAIHAAESTIETYLGFHLIPTYDVAERHVTTGPYRPELVNFNGRRVAGFRNAVRTSWGYVIEYGRRTVATMAIIQQNVPPLADLVWSAGGYWEIGTVLADATGITDPEEVRIYYPGHRGDDDWEIRPTEVSIAAGVATITFKRELGVAESVWNTVGEAWAADPEDDADFLASVDVARVYTDASLQGTSLWEPVSDCGECGDNNCPACVYREGSGCLLLVGDGRLGYTTFAPATWDADNGQYTYGPFPVGRQPDAFDINYLSGWRENSLSQPRRRMSQRYREAVAYFAAALLDRPPCDCAPDSWEYWREDVSSTVTSFGQGGRIQRVSAADLANPFGTKRGMIYAWKRIGVDAGPASAIGAFVNAR